MSFSLQNPKGTQNLVPPSLSKRIGALGIGLLANQAMVWAFNFALYPFVIWKFGLLMGAGIMVLLSFLVCYGTMLFYDWAKKDWLGIETIKDVRQGKTSTMLGRLSSWALTKSDPVVMLFLSIKFDPFITTTYMRQGSHQYNGLSVRDWRIFVGSLLIGNIYWTLAMFTGVSILEWLWLQLIRLT